ncbi:MAG: homoserine O-acetyltransferase [Gammaproteobacteria bacterium]|nr:homoserine O-acetyltransferase [Gammaproteobacteria bacterium]
MKASVPDTRDSVGIVEPQLLRFEQGVTLQCGEVLPNFELIYETYGQLNADRSNAILICHALSGHHHAAGYHHENETRPGWWDNCIGPGKPIDTSKFHVVSLNNLGGCHGSTGPRSTNPSTGEPYGETFPTVTVRDWVNTQAILADALNIEKFAAVVGGSLGGMQALQWAIDFPDRIGHAVLIACAPKLSAQNIAFNEIARLAIKMDSVDGSSDGALPGLGLARMIGHVTYLSDDSMGTKFGREVKSGDIEQGKDVQFQVESYLHYQGSRFAQTFDPNTYVLVTRALDYFDPAMEHNDNLENTLRRVKAKFLVISFSSDWRFSPERSDEIVDALVAAGKPTVSANITSSFGHDSFLMDIPRYFNVLKKYLASVAEELDA